MKNTSGMFVRRLIFHFTIWVICCLLRNSPVDAAPPMPWELEKLDSRPNPSVVIEVQVALDILSITQINEPDENFRMHAIYDISWKDSRLAFDPERYEVQILDFEEDEVRETMEALWWPELNFRNSYSKQEIENEVLLIYPDGTVKLHMAINAHLQYLPDLAALPFDQQVLPIVIEAFGYTTEEVTLTFDLEHSGYETDVMPAHWNVEDMDYQSKFVSVRHRNHSVAQLVFVFVIG